MSPRAIPNKSELLRLQKLYRTDKKIAGVLGNGVTEHLVAYWRRKKGIAAYSFPKFSEREVQEVWDRFGDDFHAGMELGISKAAFYNWRRRYKITKKPEALKLEQLTLELYTKSGSGHKRIGSGRQTIVQKLIALKIKNNGTQIGESFDIIPDSIIVLKRGDEILNDFSTRGITYIKNPGRIIVSCEGVKPNKDGDRATVRKKLRDFSRQQTIKNILEAGDGGLQAVFEKGLVLPGQLVVGDTDDILAFGCLAAPAFRLSVEEITAAWIEGKISIKIPETVRVIINGRSPRAVFARDIAGHIITQLPTKEIKDKILELCGSGIDQLSVSERFALCHLLGQTGARSVMTPFDSTVSRFITPRARKPFVPVLADRNAVYIAEYTYDLNTMRASALADDDKTRLYPLDQLSDVTLQAVFLGGITNGRIDDLRIAADILRGKKIDPDLRLTIQPASRQIYLDALKKGILRLFLEAGANVLGPGASPGEGAAPQLADGETGLSTYDRHAINAGKGRLFFVSPATAAASSITGRITDPSGYLKV